MGMAASQARFLGLTARKTNVEYEGQQVNQQRTALANQSAGLFNEMLSLEVPTPPLATNFSKTEYVFTNPSNSDQVSLDSIYKNSDGETYTVSGYVKRKTVTSNTSSIVPKGDGSNVYTIDVDPNDKSKYVISVNGGTAMSLKGPTKFNALIDEFQDADKANGVTDDLPQEDDYFFTYTNPQTGIQYFIKATGADETPMDLAARGNNDSDGDGVGDGFKIYSAESSTTEDYFHIDNAKVETAGDGTGRFTYITFTPEGSENPVRCKLTQQTVQDDDAFNQAMETYNAKKDLYDKAVADIDAKTSVIQQQDRTLELHLDQLDTEQQAIQTEMDAVKKVIDKNIEETFKTFA